MLTHVHGGVTVAAQVSLISSFRPMEVQVDREDYSFLADFLSAEIIAECFYYPPQRANETVVDSGGEGVANMPNTSDGLFSIQPGPIERTQIQRLISRNVNSNTDKSTKNWVNKLTKWAAENHVQQDLAKIPEEELDTIRQKYCSEIRKNDSENYEPESLEVMQSSLDRSHLAY